MNDKAITIHELFELIEKMPFCDYIVELNYKYDSEKIYHVSKEILYYDGEFNSFVWLNDWDEGYNDVLVTGLIRIDDINIHEGGVL